MYTTSFDFTVEHPFNELISGLRNHVKIEDQKLMSSLKQASWNFLNDR